MKIFSAVGGLPSAVVLFFIFLMVVFLAQWVSHPQESELNYWKFYEMGFEQAE